MSSDYTLAYGTHPTPQDGRCAMEWVSYVAGEPHSDEPVCVSPVLRALCVALNDGLADEPRQRLRPYLTRTIGTAGDGLDPARAWMAMDWLIRVYTPAWLRLAEIDTEAQELAELAPVIDEASLRGALAPLERTRRRARNARAHAFRETGTPRTAAWASAMAAGVAGREAAWSCAGAAAWAAARIAVGDMAGDRARAAARSAAGDAAAIAGRAASNAATADGAGSTREQARAGARDALAPTLATLAESAIGLLERMLPTETVAIPAAAQAPEAVFTTSV
jgi:hypothetical protein